MYMLYNHYRKPSVLDYNEDRCWSSNEDALSRPVRASTLFHLIVLRTFVLSHPEQVKMSAQHCCVTGLPSILSIQTDKQLSNSVCPQLQAIKTGVDVTIEFT